MRAARFRGEVLAGHKEAAVEVPFDPGERFGSQAVSIRRGRRGHPVRASIGDVSFDGYVVARSRRFWLLLDDDVLRRAEAAVGDTVVVALRPAAAPNA